MAVLRTAREENFKVFVREKITRANEWQTESHIGRLEEEAWIKRYEYESDILSNLCKNNNLSKVIEYGSGPGTIGDLVNTKTNGIDWTNIDKIGAKDEFEKRGYTGKFFVKDLMNTFDTTDLDDDYDNFIYFMWIHGWAIEDVLPSPLKTQFVAKLDSEQTMPDELVQSWNWYFIGKKRAE
jgi:hypothetical protein